MSDDEAQKTISRAEAAKARALERELFGGAAELIDNASLEDHLVEAEEVPFSIASYVRDASAVGGVQDQVEVTVKPNSSKSRSQRRERKRKPAWIDDADNDIAVEVAAEPRLRKLRATTNERILKGSTYEDRLRGQHKRLHPGTEWATLRSTPDASQPGSALDAQIQSVSHLTVSGWSRYAAGVRGADVSQRRCRDALAPGRIELTRMRDANMHQRTNGVVRALEFHPNGQLLLTAGYDKRLSFFQADGVRNSLIQSVFLEDMPVHTASFADGGRAVIASGRRKFFYVLDLETQKVERVKGVQGRDERSLERFVVPHAHNTSTGGDACIAFLGNEGTVPLVSLSTRQWAGELRVNGAVRCAAFSRDGQALYTGGTDGQVYVWDMRMRRCVHKFVDDGCVRGTSLATGSAGVLASGSESGVVNIYRDLADHDEGHTPAAPTPAAALTNLVTAADTLTFSPDSQMLCIASRMKRDALRLVHVPSLTVFHNWPTGRTPLHYVHAAAFSPGGGLFAIGNAKGHALLYRLHHYAEF